DDVLRPVSDAQISVGRHAGDVAGAEPPVVELLGRRVAVVGARDPRPSGLDLADRVAVPREDRPVVADDAQLDAGNGAPGEAAPLHLFRGPGLDTARRMGDGGD